MISEFNKAAVLGDMTIEHRQIKRNRLIEITCHGCDILYVISGECCLSGRRLSAYSSMILERGSHTVECCLAGDALVEIVVVHVALERLFHPSSLDHREQQRFEAAVLKGISTNISIDTLASICCLSVSTFKRRFFDYYGTPPHRWFLWRRLEIAEVMLRRSSIPTFVVARLCGFINVSHFIASFKRRYGITPSRLIRQRVAEVAMGALPHCPGSRIW